MPVPVRVRSKEVKRFRDNAVTGDYVRLSATAVAIVDTPLFQRLRYLRQLGTAEYVYPGATHTRFAHSLGVAHRAKEFALRLAERQPELVLEDSDLVVLEVAGLCHDLGHGPFSHSFESELVPRLLAPGEAWEHEHQSCLLLDHICELYDADLTAEEQQRVKDLIIGDRSAAQGDWPECKLWQFDIVANKRNGLDVDKLDYLKRDNAACGELTTNEFSSLFENMRVLGGEVCFRSSVRSAVQEVYAARAKMHEFVYTHPVAKACEYMVTDALLQCAEELGIREALRDPERFALLDDTALRAIERSTSQSPGMQRAQELLRRLRHRDIYKHVGSVDVPHSRVTSMGPVSEADILQHADAAAGVALAPGDIRVHNLKIDYTCQDRNPLENVGFYVNEEDEEPACLEQNPFAPGTFVTRQVRVYLVRLCSSPEQKRRYSRAAQAAFDRWCRVALGAGRLVISPQKSMQTVSGEPAALASRKRQRQGSSSQLAPGNSTGRAASAGGGGAAAAVEDAIEQLAAGSSPAAAKKQLAFASSQS